MRIAFLAIIFCLFNSYQVTSQVPYHYFLGAEELSGTHVYGITQAPDQTYWITTDRGLYSYNGYLFKNYDHPDLRSSSLFNPTIDHLGILHCNNLNGQIFKVVDDQMLLAHTIPDSLLSSYMDFEFTSKNELLVLSKSIYKLVNNEIEIIAGARSSVAALSTISRDLNNDLLVRISTDTLFRINSFVEKIQLNYEGVEAIYDLGIVCHQDGIYIGVEGNSLLIVEDTTATDWTFRKILEINAEISRIYITSHNIWIAKGTSGVLKYDLPSEYGTDVDTTRQERFSDYFISYVYEDVEGNLLLGTFGDGVIVIPQTVMINETAISSLNVSRITSDQNGGLLLGTSNGNVYEWNTEKVKPIFTEGSKFIEILEYWEKEGLIFLDRNAFLAVNKNGEIVATISTGAVKDLVRIENNVIGLATNRHLITMSLPNKEIISNQQIGRTYTLSYNNLQKSFLVGTSQGLFAIDSVEQKSALLLDGESLLVNDLVQLPEIALVATQGYGLLKEENNQLSKFINEQGGLLSNNIRQVETTDNFIFIASEAGFQVFDMNGTLVKTLNASDGLISSKIQDFVVDESYLWFLHQSGVQKMPLSQIGVEESVQKFNFIKVFVEDELVNLNQVSSFMHEDNNVRFEINASSLRKNQGLSYDYFLEGADQRWKSSPYSENMVEYLSLPPGQYSFKVRLIHKGTINDEAELNFTIAAPYWQLWWFYILCAAIIILIAYLIFRKILRGQKLRADQLNELNASKLSALQSQMNPHFIFNALNSIQEYIMLNERKLAGKYLGKFADLMRIYLNYSQTKSITLQEEIDALHLYLDLEKLRFEDVLSYSVNVEEKVDVSCMIPSLLIQPYVENALKHGLLHKVDNRILRINFKFNSEHQVIECHVEDNGIGRQKSFEINQRRNPHHKSFASGATKNRLKLLNHNLAIPIGEETIDLFQEDGSSSGTMVIISIPIMRKGLGS